MSINQVIPDCSLRNVEPFRNSLTGGWAIKADLFAGQSLLAKVVDQGDGTVPDVSWENTDQDICEQNEEVVLAWYRKNSAEDPEYTGFVDLETAILFMRDLWAGSL